MTHTHDCGRKSCKTTAQRIAETPTYFRRMDGPASEKARKRQAAVAEWHKEHGVEHQRSACR